MMWGKGSTDSSVGGLTHCVNQRPPQSVHAQLMRSVAPIKLDSPGVNSSVQAGLH